MRDYAIPKNNLLEAQEKQDSYESKHPGPKRPLKMKSVFNQANLSLS